jgi:hypothetical protein
MNDNKISFERVKSKEVVEGKFGGGEGGEDVTKIETYEKALDWDPRGRPVERCGKLERHHYNVKKSENASPSFLEFPVSNIDQDLEHSDLWQMQG